MMALWSIVLPVKEASRAKSRLNVPGVEHTLLARAIALGVWPLTAEVLARAPLDREKVQA